MPILKRRPSRRCNVGKGAGQSMAKDITWKGGLNNAMVDITSRCYNSDTKRAPGSSNSHQKAALSGATDNGSISFLSVVAQYGLVSDACKLMVPQLANGILQHSFRPSFIFLFPGR
ncbi:hypothetical protein MUK42_17714 [Musa troglodytarum]|uniref:Uncharacterized protein n=1 Tax=Musa troglodytarum TaxID=320322 RepID=A0A9E7L2K6_9LILI|nr:hypothetical protein MUK42_17714 [Musa troglodytarum]